MTVKCSVLRIQPRIDSDLTTNTHTIAARAHMCIQSSEQSERMLDNRNMGGGDGRPKYSHIPQEVRKTSL